MSKAKVAEACLGGFGAPLFPSTIDLLNTTLGERYGLDGFVLKEVGDMVEGFVGKWRPTTTDGYTWFWALTFTRGGGTIVVCFPYARDGERRDGSPADRSAAVYAVGVDDGVTTSLVADLVRALKSV